MSEVSMSIDMAGVARVHVERVESNGGDWFKIYFYGKADESGYEPYSYVNVFGAWSGKGRVSPVWDVSAVASPVAAE